ncbi:MAG: methylenetetrahydrofolate--tRNA-(uracil(54)-C(5))-methyltransferase (FADH(2)-oxidizing) TrmFO [Clostridia bacterium]|nr:methylenetetrahydrofolate--tRNA-(uracil(54)-C(5))-methyltransferase (FADH(2)-oxidizing) TrmFO [Clostridia bacterium]
MEKHINVYGAGLAGCEAAWQAARRGVAVTLYEMQPRKFTPAHHSESYAELVCSNSLRSDRITVASGLLKEELSRMGSLIMEAARATQVPAGSALAVDRDKFSAYITEKIKNHPLITVVEAEITQLPTEGITVVATGPLTSDPFADWLKDHLVGEGFHFFDAVAPIVDAASINMDVAFFASRYNKGDADYINCPMTREQYDAFYNALITAEEAELKDFDRDLKVFEGCMPVEVMARRGYDTLRYGPLKPVGLVDRRTDARSYAVVQLRRENKEGTMYNLVGFQTHLTFPAQKRVFSMIPGLENAEFLRYGVMHRNTYLPSPDLLDADYRLRKGYAEGQVYFAGQMTGVEGYIESTGSGFVAGLNAARRALGMDALIFPETTMIGAMAHYISHGGLSDFVPMNANFGIIPGLDHRVKGGKLARYEIYAARALEAIDGVMDAVQEGK